MRERLGQQLQTKKLLFDGAFGTYYAYLYDTRRLPEWANVQHPERVLRIHEEYIAAGAEIIRTNTFAANTISMECDESQVREIIRQGYRIALQASGQGEKALVAADIGQIDCRCETDRERLSAEYVKICQFFLEEGAEIFVFETFSDLEDIKEAIRLVADRAFVIVQFAVNQFGYSDFGFSARKLLQRAEELEGISAAGFNCGVGPAHMQKLLQGVRPKKPLSVLPNAGYPQLVSNRMIFDHQNIDYFVDKLCDIAREGADIVGGCCGTTPEYIKRLRAKLNTKRVLRAQVKEEKSAAAGEWQDCSFFGKAAGRKLIAVELAPPVGSDAEKLMDAAHLLKKSGVDVLTFPDSPSGRTRADSVLMAEKVARETGMCVMPHLCCRDKNAIAMRSQLLGAYVNDIRNFLVITGDPIPLLVRSSIKSVFNFDSVGLMRMMKDMNEEQFAKAPIWYGGAINQGRRNIEVEIGRVKKKLEAGAAFFLTQPITTKEGAERVKRIKEETKARILCGIMPFVSLKNALFMKNEMTGIEVNDSVLLRYRADMTREEGEEAGIALAKEIMQYTEDFADGYYFSFPFNRVGMLEKILN